MKKYKVLYLINYAPNYRDKFLTELAKYVDLTVTAYLGKEADLVDPEHRDGYKFISLKRKKFLGINFNIDEFALAHKVQGVAGVYNKAEYLHDRKIINQWYSDFLDSLVQTNDD